MFAWSLAEVLLLWSQISGFCLERQLKRMEGWRQCLFKEMQVRADVYLGGSLWALGEASKALSDLCPCSALPFCHLCLVSDLRMKWGFYLVYRVLWRLLRCFVWKYFVNWCVSERCCHCYDRKGRYFPCQKQCRNILKCKAMFVWRTEKKKKSIPFKGERIPGRKSTHIIYKGLTRRSAAGRQDCLLILVHKSYFWSAAKS